MKKPSEPIHLFYSYSHKDEGLRDQLENHLKLLQREGYITGWHDRRISAGTEWAGQIDEHLKQAEIILLLISSDFIASDYCYDLEMKAAMERHDKGEAVVIPVILREVDWTVIAPFKKLQAIPKDGNAITSRYWHNEDEAFANVAKRLREKIEELSNNSDDILKKIKAIEPETEKVERVNRLQQFPKSKPYFTGREDELNELRKAYDRSPFIFIDGPGGIGKTQFVAKFIEGLKEKNKIVWYECQPTSEADDIISGAGFDELLKGKEKLEREKYSAFKDKIEEGQLDVFIDNYHDVQGKSSFINFLQFIEEYLAKGHIIILGRDNIISPSLHPKHIKLQGLGDSSFLHAKGLIAHAYPDKKNIQDETLKKICEEFKGYPLAIDLAVYLLSENVPAGEILEVAVQEAKKKDYNNEKISERLLNEIFVRTDASDDEKIFLKIFSVHRGKVQEDAIKAIIPNDIFRNASRSLIKRNLLESDGNYFELHPLIREFCYEHLQDKKSVHAKAAQYYLNKRNEHFNAEVEEKLFFHLSKAHDWEEIKNTIITKGKDFIRQGYLDRLQQMITDSIAHNCFEPKFDIYLGDIQETKGDWDKALELYGKAKFSLDEKIKIEGLIKYGEMYYRKGSIKESVNYFEEALNLTEKESLNVLRARVLNDLGLVNNFYGLTTAALESLTRSLKIREAEEIKEDIASSLQNIGSVNRTLGRSQEALDLYQRSLTIREEIGDKLGISNSLNSIGLVKSELGKNQEALDLYERSLNISQEIGDKSGIAASLNNIGLVKSELGKNQEAFKLFERSLNIGEEIGDKSAIATSLSNIGLVKSELGKNQEALELFERSLNISQEIGDKSGIANSLNNIGGVKSALGQKHEALELYERSLQIREEVGDKSGIANSLNNIGSIKNALGKKQEALELHERSLHIREEIGEQSGIASSLNNIGLVKSELGKKQEALKFYERSLHIREEIGDKSGIANSLNNIGGVKIELGKKQEALELQERSLHIREEIGEKSGIANSLNNIGLLKSELGKKQEALEFYKRSLNIGEEIGDKSAIAAALCNIGCISVESNLNESQIMRDLLKSFGLFTMMNMTDSSVPKSFLIRLRKKMGRENFKKRAVEVLAQVDKELKDQINLEEFLGNPVHVEKKVGRNDLCPCGSGEKYKNCHGKED